ncbi:MAG: DUF302 domain-containing protein [Burkholderiaceae bacterium]|jgi:uncharacterized protein (DUF302 family)
MIIPAVRLTPSAGFPETELLELASPYSFPDTLERLSHAIESAGLTLFARIDHRENARNVGLSMPATVVLTYGNPLGGTAVMLASPAAALDLPLRVLIREDASGQVIVAFRPIATNLASLGTPREIAKKLEPAQWLLVKALQ